MVPTGPWSPEQRSGTHEPSPPRDALPPETVANFIAWIATAPPELVLDEAIVTPLNEQGCP